MKKSQMRQNSQSSRVYPYCRGIEAVQGINWAIGLIANLCNGKANQPGNMVLSINATIRKYKRRVRNVGGGPLNAVKRR